MPVGQLPSYDVLKSLYLQGWTYQQLAAEYGCSTSTIYGKLKKTGEQRQEWPLSNESLRRERIRRTRIGTCQMELEDSSMLVTRLQIRIAEFNGSVNQFCRLHDLRPTTVGELLRGEKPKISRQLADRLRSALRVEPEGFPPPSDLVSS